MGLLTILALLAPSANAYTWTVCQSGGCDFWEIEIATQIAAPGDVIEVQQGFYNENIITIDRDVTLIAIDGPAVTTISPSSDLFRIQGGTVFTLQGFTIEGSNGGKRPIRNDQGALVFIDDCIFQDFWESNNGNVVDHRNNADTIISNSQFINNGQPSCCNDGGAIRTDSGTLTITDSIFENNLSGSGGAISAFSTNVTLSNTQFTNNYAQQEGGALWIESGTLQVDNVQFHLNEANQDGGAIWTNTDNVIFDKTDFCGNLTGSQGGALYFDGTFGSVQLSNSRMWDNDANWGSAIYAQGSATNTLLIDQSTFANNTGNTAVFTENTVDLIATNSLFVDHSNIALEAQGVWVSDYNAFWNNGTNASWGTTTTDINQDPDLLEYTPNDGRCDDRLIPSHISPVVDAGSGFDLDGSPSMTGVTGGLGAEPTLWDDLDGDGMPAMWDCDDSDASITREVWWVDNDGDGLGDPDNAQSTCAPSIAWVQNSDDCDDYDAFNGIALTWYPDMDGDGYGDDASTGALTCWPTGNDVLTQGDCDDADPMRNPGWTEVCDGFDNDCNLLTDEFDNNLDRSTLTDFYLDADGDTHGDPSNVIQACFQPGNGSLFGTDCDDSSATTFPGATDLCGDGIDSNCDAFGGPDDDEDLDGLTWAQEDQFGGNDCNTDTDGDGLLDSVEATYGDSDGDSVFDLADTDDDDDGVLTIDENFLGSDPRNWDSDGDGVPDGTEAPGGTYVDTDGDFIPNILDDDDDNDTIPTAVEGEDDVDSDGTPNYLDLDSDNEGDPDEIEGTGDADGDTIPDFLDPIDNNAIDVTDTDGDGITDADELLQGTDPESDDSDGDGLLDGEETGDTDGDGTIDALDNDDDGDGIATSDESGDTDGDGILDHLDDDDDGDGILTVDEGSDDTDGDGLANHLDPDSDNDGVVDGAEAGDANNDGTPDYLQAGGDGKGPGPQSAAPAYGFGCNTSGSPAASWWLFLPLLGMRRRA